MPIIERELSVMQHSKESSLTITLPKDWCRAHNIKSTVSSGTKLYALADKAIVILPPSVYKKRGFNKSEFKTHVIETL